MPAVSYRVRIIDDARRWDDFLTLNNGHLLQTYEWGALKSEFGWHALRIGIESDGSLVATAQMLIRRMPLLTFAYVPRGPTLAPTENEAPHSLYGALIDAARKENAMLLKIEPNVIEANQSDGFLPAGFIQTHDTIQPRTTIHLDINRDVATLLGEMKPKWRYNIRLAAKKGVTVRQAREDELPGIYRLLRLTGDRDKFAVHSYAYYERAMQLLGERACWFVAEYENEILAAIFVTAIGHEAIYLYGASGNDHRDKMPNHALHWAAIRWAKERECARYDWWGIPDNSEPGGDSLPEGLYRFKQGFGGKIVTFVGSYDYILRPTIYRLYNRLIRSRRRPGVG